MATIGFCLDLIASVVNPQAKQDSNLLGRFHSFL
jgi:hypothetical protein